MNMLKDRYFVNEVELPQIVSIMSGIMLWNWNNPLRATTVQFFYNLSACAGRVRSYKSKNVLKCVSDLDHALNYHYDFTIKECTEWSQNAKLNLTGEETYHQFSEVIRIIREEALKSEKCEFIGVMEEEGAYEEMCNKIARMIEVLEQGPGSNPPIKITAL